jgi:hypothetical protein
MSANKRGWRRGKVEGAGRDCTTKSFRLEQRLKDYKYGVVSVTIEIHF